MNDELLLGLVRMAAHQRGLAMFSALGILYQLSPRQAPGPVQRLRLFGAVEADGERWAVDPADTARRIATRRDGDAWTVIRIDHAARCYQVAPMVQQLRRQLGAAKRLATVPETVVHTVSGMPPFTQLVATAANEPGRIQTVELVTDQGNRLGLWIRPLPIDAGEVRDALDVPATYQRRV